MDIDISWGKLNATFNMTVEDIIASGGALSLLSLLAIVITEVI